MRYQDDRLERVVLGISAAMDKDKGGLRGVYWERVSEVMEQLEYLEHEWGEKWIEAAKDRKKWRQGVSEVVKRYKQDVDYDTSENRHTEQHTSFEREVRQAIGELDDQGRACCPRCGGWQSLKIFVEFGLHAFLLGLPAHVERCGAALAGTGRPGGGEVGHRITAVVNFVSGGSRGRHTLKLGPPRHPGSAHHCQKIRVLARPDVGKSK